MSVEALARQLAAVAPATLERFLATCDAEEHEAVEAALALLEQERAQAEQQWAEVEAGQWRRNPATLVHHLSGGQRRMWRYVMLLAERFRSAFADLLKLDEPANSKQIWMLPSQMGKTSALMAGVVWALDQDPTVRLMYVSYDANKAVEEAGWARDFAIEHASELRFQLRADRKARGMWRTSEGGGLYAVGIYGGITGWPADAILLDDLFKGWQAAHSETERNAVWNIYRSQVRLRAQGQQTPIISAGTRWHEDDVPARLIAASEEPFADQFTVTRLPARAEAADPNAHDPLLRDPDPLGREPGEIIEPERFDEREVSARAATLGAYLAAALESQRPSPPEGNDIKRDWFRFDDALPAEADAVITSWDMKLKDKEAGDFVVGQTWLRTGPDFWLVDQLRGQWDQPTVENAIALSGVRADRRGWTVRLHVIENTGNGPEVRAALSEAKRDYEVSDHVAGLLGMSESERAAVTAIRRRGMSNLKPEKVEGDKRVRMRTQSGILEAGHVHVWAAAPWVAAYVEEMAAFPNGTHDDQVDSTSQALKYLRKGGVATLTAPRGQVGSPPIVAPRQVGATLRTPTGHVSPLTRLR